MSKWLENLYEIENLTMELDQVVKTSRALAEAYDNADCETAEKISPLIKIYQSKVLKIVKDYNERMDKFVKDKF